MDERAQKTRKGGAVLVTGGAGFIGCWVVRDLLGKGYHVRVMDDFSTGCLSNLPSHPRLEVVEGDVAHARDMDQAAAGACLIIHLAAVVGVRLAHSQADRAYRVSVDAARNLFSKSRAPMVLASSSAVYGLTCGGATREDDPIDEDTVRAYDGGHSGYALGKWHAELLAREAAGRGQQVLVLRLFNTIGPRQTDRYGMVLPTFVRAALAGRPLVVHGDGLQTRCFSDVHTVSSAIVGLALEAELESTVFNVGSTAQIPIVDLARVVIEEAGSDSAIVHVPYDEVFPGRQDVLWRRPDTSRLQAVVGPIQWPGIRSIVREVVAWERERSSTLGEEPACG
jgi:UDP-glucose 4-epimerase